MKYFKIFFTKKNKKEIEKNLNNIKKIKIYKKKTFDYKKNIKNILMFINIIVVISMLLLYYFQIFSNNQKIIKEEKIISKLKQTGKLYKSSKDEKIIKTVIQLEEICGIKELNKYNIKGLKKLDCSDSILTNNELDNLNLSLLKKIEEIDLNNNFLSSFPYKFINQFKKLKTLKLKNNIINTVYLNKIKTKIHLLDLSHNGLSYFYINKKINNIDTINISYNTIKNKPNLLLLNKTKLIKKYSKFIKPKLLKNIKIIKVDNYNIKKLKSKIQKIKINKTSNIDTLIENEKLNDLSNQIQKKYKKVKVNKINTKKIEKLLFSDNNNSKNNNNNNIIYIDKTQTISEIENDLNKSGFSLIELEQQLINKERLKEKERNIFLKSLEQQND